MKKEYIIGTRKSLLAMTQTEQTVALLEEKFPDIKFVIKGIVTKGDRLAHVHLSKIGGKGVFMKKIEQAIVAGEIDFAVHSMKDVPSYLPDEVTIASIPKRNSPWDCILARERISTLDDLPIGSIIGSSSVRRSAQILAIRPDLIMKNLRGNVDTRYQKLMEEDYDAIILAEAGLNRLGWGSEVPRFRLESEICLPSVGQGALAIECLKERHELVAMLQEIECQETRKCVTAERVFLSEMDGSCTFPIGGYAKLEGDSITFTGFLGTADGQTILKETARGTNPVALGKEVAKRFYQRGAADIISRFKKHD